MYREEHECKGNLKMERMEDDKREIGIRVGLSTLSVCQFGLADCCFIGSRSNNQTDQEMRGRD
jgi:hypothetical protein